MSWIRVALLCLCCGIASAQEIPAGTVIPVMLSTTLKSKQENAGQKIEGKVMQEVPLPGSAKIEQGARISGRIVKVEDTPSGSMITLHFDQLEDSGHSMPVTVRLLAVASMATVAEAQSPVNSNRDSENNWVTRQVGGDVVKRGQGKAFSRAGETGRWLHGSAVMMKLAPMPELGCPSGAGYDREQALWIFSSGACGAYGWKNVTIDRGAKTAGAIVLRSTEKVEIRGGSGWLLITSDSMPPAP